MRGDETVAPAPHRCDSFNASKNALSRLATILPSLRPDAVAEPETSTSNQLYIVATNPLQTRQDLSLLATGAKINGLRRQHGVPQIPCGRVTLNFKRAVHEVDIFQSQRATAIYNAPVAEDDMSEMEPIGLRNECWNQKRSIQGQGFPAA